MGGCLWGCEPLPWPVTPPPPVEVIERTLRSLEAEGVVPWPKRSRAISSDIVCVCVERYRLRPAVVLNDSKWRGIAVFAWDAK